jgi:hypothetical protein
VKTIHIVKLSVQSGFLLSSLILCASAIALSIRNPFRRFRLAIVLATIALGITVMGVWAPVSFWPRMGFAWQFSNGWHISFDCRWLFVLPMLIAVATCALVAWRRGRLEAVVPEEGIEPPTKGL